MSCFTRREFGDPFGFGLSRHPKQAEAEYHSPRRRLAEANQQRPPPRVKLDRGVGRPAGIHCVVMQHRYPDGDGA
jgi:hypothetical protein